MKELLKAVGRIHGIPGPRLRLSIGRLYTSVLQNLQHIITHTKVVWRGDFSFLPKATYSPFLECKYMRRKYINFETFDKKYKEKTKRLFWRINCHGLFKCAYNIILLLTLKLPRNKTIL